MADILSRREENKNRRLERVKEAVSKGEEPSRFYHNIGKAVLLVPLLVMMVIWMWVLSLYSETPEMIMPVFFLGMAFIIPIGILTGIMEYWLYVWETPTIKLGHLAPMAFHFLEWVVTVNVPYQTKAGDKLVDTWQCGRVGKTNWMWSKGGGKRGYYAVRILPRLIVDDSHNPPKLVEKDAEAAGYWEGSQYRVPVDCSRTYVDRLKEEIARKLRSDKYFREDSPIFAGERPLPEQFRTMESLSDMETKLHDRNEEIAMLRAKIRRMNIDESIRRSTEPDIKKETVIYKGGGPE